MNTRFAPRRGAILLLLLWLVCPAAFTAELSALVGWSQRVELGTLVSGVVAEVHVRPGQLVDKGAVLLSLDGRGFGSMLSRRQAEHRHAQSVLAEAEREDERAAELYDRTVLSDVERNQALVALLAARAAAEGARARLVAAQLEHERSVLRAPFAAVVLAVNATPGQSVVSELQSQPLVTLADHRRYRAITAVGLGQLGALQPGMPLTAQAHGQRVEARVSHVGFEPVAESPQGPRYELVAELEWTHPQPLRPGETITLSWPDEP